MAPWTLALALVKLRSELNARWPNRDRSSDGAIGDTAHAATASDHNPNAEGVVCAYDVDTDLDGTDDSNDPEMDALVEHFRTNPHPTLKYLIYRGRMFSSYAARGFAPFEWRPYSKDPHVSHPHVSVGIGPDGQSAPGTYDDTSSWLAGFTFGAPDGEEDQMTPAESKAALDALGRIDNALNDPEHGVLARIVELERTAGVGTTKEGFVGSLRIVRRLARLAARKAGATPEEIKTAEDLSVESP